jgi:hypothetical protein
MSDRPPCPPSIGLQQRIKTEPFQIFCLKKRKEVTEANPSLTYPEITSILGRLWRSLSSDEKAQYVELAISFPASPAFEGVTHPVQPPPLGRISTYRSTLANVACPIPSDPLFPIIARGASGRSVLAASHEFLFTHGFESISFVRGMANQQVGGIDRTVQ